MSKIAVVYWSSTGNTEEMASCVAEGIKAAGGEAELHTPGSFNAQMMDDYEAVAFGCPSMGAEQLEETEFEPMFSACEEKLAGKRIALFGSCLLYTSFQKFAVKWPTGDWQLSLAPKKRTPLPIMWSR